MEGSHRRHVVFVPDDATVVTYTELIRLLEELGTVGMVALHLGVSGPTVSRHLTSAGVPSVDRFVPRMGEVIETQREEIEKLRRELEERDEQPS